MGRASLRSKFIFLVVVGTAVLAVLASVAPAGATLPTSVIEQHWELLGKTVSKTSSGTFESERGVLPGAATMFDPAPTASFQVVGRVTGGTSGGWSVYLKDGAGSTLASVTFSTTETTYRLKTASISWPATDVALGYLSLSQGSALAGTLDVRKAYIKIHQSGTVQKTLARAPVATYYDQLTSTTWADLGDPIFYKHTASIFDPAPVIRLLANTSVVGMGGTGWVRLIAGDGTVAATLPVGLSETYVQSGPLSLTDGQLYRLQTKVDASTTLLRLWGADVVFEQSTTDTNGLAKAVAFYPSLTEPTQAGAEANLDFQFLAPELTSLSATYRWMITAQAATAQTTSVQLRDRDTATSLGSASSGTTSYSYHDGVVSAPTAGHALDTRAGTSCPECMSPGGVPMISSSVLRVALQLRDTTPPAAPVISTPAAGAALNTSSVTISGTAEANSTVTVKEGAATLGTATTNGSGAWSRANTFTDGSHTINATATDAAGNVSAASADRTFTVDTTAPPVPVISSPLEGAFRSTSSVTISGTAEVNATVTVKEGGTTLGTATADGTGAWSRANTLTDGSHSITATATDAVGNASPASAVRTFTVDTAAPPAPVITTPSSGGLYPGTFTLSGTAEVNAIVTIKEGTTTLETPIANAQGAWSVSHTFTAGSHTITATATDGAGNTSVPSANRTFTVDTTPPAAPGITTPAGGGTYPGTFAAWGTAEPYSTVTIKEGVASLGTTAVNGDGAWSKALTFTTGSHTISATATDGAGNLGPASPDRSFTVDAVAPAAPTIATPTAGAALNSSSVTISGTAEANATVTVKEGVSTLGTATADGSGAWSRTNAFADGSHTIYATATDAVGNTSAASSNRSFSVDTTPPPPPVIASPAAGAAVGTSSVTISGTAEANATVTLKEGASTLGTATANGSGAWSRANTFADGSHTISATATDAAGNTSGASANRTFTVDTAPPPAPVISSPLEGALQNTSSVTVSGTAEANSTVTVKEGPTTLGTAPANGSGAWSAALSFADGSHTITAIAADAAGNASPSSASRTFTVDTTAPAPPVITTPAVGAALNTSSVTISGTAEVNAIVTVKEGATTLGTPIANGSGAWSVSATFADGSHAITATAADGSGNVSAAANRSFGVDTLAPAAPVITTPSAGGTYAGTFMASGTAEANVTVTVKEGATTLGTITANGSGAWSKSLTFADGSHTINATATDAAGNLSPASPDRSFSVDAIAPAAPAISTPAPNATLNTSSVTISGSAEANATVTVKEGAATLGTATADGSGAWSRANTLADGSHTIYATATDAVGNVSPASASRTFAVDTTAPAISGFAASPTPFSPGTDANKDSTTFAASLFDASAVTWTIQIRDGSDLVVRTLAGSGATVSQIWNGTDTLGVVVPDATYNATLTATDAASLTTSAGPVAVTVDTAAPVISGYGATPASISPNADGTADSTTLSAELSDPSTPVTWTIEVKSASGTTVRTFAGSGGPVSQPWDGRNAQGSLVLDGSYTAELRATDDAGNESTSPATISVDATAPVLSTLAASPNPFKDATTFTATLSDGSPVAWTLSIKDSTAIVVRTFTGTATALSEPWDATNAEGAKVPDGTYTATLSVTDAAGNPATSAPRTVLLDTTRPQIGLIAPRDGGNTLFASQPIIATVADYQPSPFGPGGMPTSEPGETQGSGIDPDSLSVEVQDANSRAAGGQTPTPTLTGTQMRTSAVSLNPGSKYRVTISATDFVGNTTTLTGEFLTMRSAVASLPQVSIASVAPDSVVPGDAMDPLDRYTWQSPQVDVGPFTVTLDQTLHTGDGSVNVSFDPRAAQVHYTVHGLPAVAPVLEQSAAQVSALFRAASTGTVTATTTAQSNPTTALSASVPKTADAGSVRLVMSSTAATQASFPTCADPTAQQGCLPDPLPVDRKEGIWGPWANLANVDPYDLPAEVAPLVGLTLPAPDPVCAGTQAPPSLADAIVHLGQALGTSDSVTPGLSLSPELETGLARLTDCIAMHTARLPVVTGDPTEAQQAEWLAAQRDVLSAVHSFPETVSPMAECTVLDDPGLKEIEVCGTSGTTHTRDRTLLVDLGGSDRYYNNAGGAIVDPSGVKRPLALVLDLFMQGGADDTYQSTRSSCGSSGTPAIGSGSYGGVGIVVDRGGDDTYTADRCAIGSATRGGGYLLDLSGKDTYTGDGWSVGFGLDGFGFVVDSVLPNDPSTSGCNTFTSDLGIGAGETTGFSYPSIGVGLVVGGPDQDCYVGGSWSVGFAFSGVAGSAVGGVIDSGGADTYSCTESSDWCIGTSYSIGAGLVLGLAADAGLEGDTYDVKSWSYETLGHSTAGTGVVSNEGGVDTYTCRALHCQGTGGIGMLKSVIYGVPGDVGGGIFIDLGGDNDNYTYQTGWSLGPYLSTKKDSAGKNVRGNTALWIGESKCTESVCAPNVFGFGLDL